MENLEELKRIVDSEWGIEEKKRDALAIIEKALNGAHDVSINEKGVLSSGDARANSIEYAMPCYEKEISGLIRWETNLTGGYLNSPDHSIGDLLWYLSYAIGYANNTSTRKVTLRTRSAPVDAYKDVRVQMYLIAQSGIDEGLAYRMPEFESKNGITLSTIEDNGFVLNNKIVIEARWTFTRKYVPSFADPVLSDAVLVVDGKRIHVNKAYLAFYSPFFFTLFYGGFSKDKEFELKALDYEHFVEYLLVLYPTRKEINETNVGYLLQLADQYDTPCVTYACAAFLIDAKAIENLKKIEYADQYRLTSVRQCAVYKLGADQSAFAQLLYSDKFAQFSDETKTLMREELARIRRVVA